MNKKIILGFLLFCVMGMSLSSVSATGPTNAEFDMSYNVGPNDNDNWIGISNLVLPVELKFYDYNGKLLQILPIMDENGLKKCSDAEAQEWHYPPGHIGSKGILDFDHGNIIFSTKDDQFIHVYRACSHMVSNLKMNIFYDNNTVDITKTTETMYLHRSYFSGYRGDLFDVNVFNNPNGRWKFANSYKVGGYDGVDIWDCNGVKHHYDKC